MSAALAAMASRAAGVSSAAAPSRATATTSSAASPRSVTETVVVAPEDGAGATATMY